MADEISDLLKLYAPPEAQAPSPLADLLANSYGTEDVRAQLPAQRSLWERFGPMGSAAMAERGPWMREYLHPQVADMLATWLQYGPAGLGSRAGVGTMRDVGMARALDQAMPRDALNGNPIDPGITGGAGRHSPGGSDFLAEIASQRPGFHPASDPPGTMGTAEMPNLPDLRIPAWRGNVANNPGPPRFEPYEASFMDKIDAFVDRLHGSPKKPEGFYIGDKRFDNVSDWLNAPKGVSPITRSPLRVVPGGKTD